MKSETPAHRFAAKSSPTSLRQQAARTGCDATGDASPRLQPRSREAWQRVDPWPCRPQAHPSTRRAWARSSSRASPTRHMRSGRRQKTAPQPRGHRRGRNSAEPAGRIRAAPGWGACRLRHFDTALRGPRRYDGVGPVAHAGERHQVAIDGDAHINNFGLYAAAARHHLISQRLR